MIQILGTDQFYWDADNIYIYDTDEPLNQIRIGRYDGDHYGIGFTNDGGATWETAVGFDGGHLGGVDYDTISGQISDIVEDIGIIDGAVSDIEDFTNTAFADGVVTRAEKEALKVLLTQLDTEKADIDSKYNSIYADTNLSGIPKTSLATAKTDYNNAHSAFLSSINTAIADNTITTVERADIAAKLATYKTELGDLSIAFEVAIRSIESAKDTALSGTLTTEINKKNKHFTSTPSGPYAVGDTWTQLATGKTYVCNTGASTGFNAAHWTLQETVVASFTGTYAQMIVKSGMKVGDIWLIKDDTATLNGRTYYAIGTSAGAASWALTSTRKFSGAAISWDAETGTVDIAAGQKASISSGGTLELVGNNLVTIGSGGNLNMVGSDVNISAGGKMNISSGGTFTVGSSNFAIDASGNVTMKGAVTADTGYIGGTSGWAITAGYLKSVAGSGYIGLRGNTTTATDIVIWAGHATVGSAPFRVQYNGKLYATDVDISGKITSTSGAIGAITLGSTGIYSGSGSNFVGWYKPSSIDTNTVSLFAGATDNAGNEADFSVTYSGKLTASDAYVNGTLKAGGYDVWNKKSIQVSSSQPSAPSLGDIWIAPAPPPETPEEDPPYSGNWTTTLGINTYLSNANGNTLSTTVSGTASGTVSGTYSYSVDVQLRITHAYFSTLYVQVKAGPSGVVVFPTQSFSGAAGFYKYTQTTTSATWIGNASSIALVINGGSSSSGMPNNAAGDIGVMSGNVLTLTCAATN